MSTTNGVSNRPGVFARALDSLFGTKPAAPDEVSGLLDEWASLRTAGGLDAAAQQTLARLSVPGGMAAVSPAGWRALTAGWLRSAPAERSAMTAQLAAAGVTASTSRDGVYVTFQDATLTVTGEPGADRLRVQREGAADCYAGGRLVQTMTFTADGATVDTAAGTEHWTSGGVGTLNGQPLAPYAAARVPGEPSRRLTAALTAPNDLDEPEWRGRSWMKVYGPEYDEAILEAGGQVVQPYAAAADADVYNCHSYATTVGAGDLFDPFSRGGQPHWLDNPMRQLSSSGFGKLAADQRVHPGDVVVYRKDGQVTHTGVVAAVDAGGNPTRVESKFGTLGLYVHDTTDVSALYGAPAEFYRPTVS